MSHDKIKAAARETHPDLGVDLAFDDIKHVPVPLNLHRGRRRDLVAAANPIDAVARIVGRQVGLIRGCDDG
jgi:hypothetical protein